jgi:hypothetical protein
MFTEVLYLSAHIKSELSISRSKGSNATVECRENEKKERRGGKEKMKTN